MDRRLLSSSGLVIGAVLFFAVNIASEGLFRSARLDLTENRLFTLSQGTERILGSLDEPVTLHFFFSSTLANSAPQLRTYGSRVRDLLDEFVALSGGKLRLVVTDPEPFSEAEDEAVSFGLQGAPINAAGDNFYFGLAGTNSVDDVEVVSFFSPDGEQFLEYDLTKLVYTLSNAKKPVVGLLSSLPLEFGPGGLQMAMRGQSRPYGIMAAMRQFFEVRSLENDLVAIDDDVDILLLIHARDLAEKSLYAIDQFVLRGGRALIFVDPFAETAAAIPPQPGMPPNPMDTHSSNLAKLFAAWGIEMDAENIVGDRTLATRVNAGAAGGRRQIVDFLSWLTIPGPMFNADDVVTSELTSMITVSAGHIVATEGAGTTLTPLIRSSANSMLIDVGRVRMRPDPQQLLADFEADDRSYVIAARLAGHVQSAFDERPATEEAAAEEGSGEETNETDAEKSAERKPHLVTGEAPLNVIVVADADLLDDRFWIRRQTLFGQEIAIPSSANADFLVNALDNLAGSSDLISLRSRARSDRPFKVVEQIRRDAEQQFLTREKALREKLSETEKQIADLQSKSSTGASTILAEEEVKAIEDFRREMLITRRELRGVQHSLRKDIERLEAWLKFVNIGAVPLAVFLAAVMLALVRYQRRRATAGLKQA